MHTLSGTNVFSFLYFLGNQILSHCFVIHAFTIKYEQIITSWKKKKKQKRKKKRDHTLLGSWHVAYVTSWCRPWQRYVFNETI